MAKWEKLMVAGCIHAPIHSEEYVDKFIEGIAKEKPDHVCIAGDLLECDALSKYGSELDFSLHDEFIAANDIRRRIRKAAPKAQLVETEGNHDPRFRFARAAKALRPTLMRAYKDATPELEYWKVLHYRNDPTAVAWFGQVGVQHGHELGTNGDRNEALRFGVQNGLMIRAHTHRPMYRDECHITNNTAVPISYANVGTLCDIAFFKEHHYARRINTSRWGARPLVVDFNPQRRMFATRQWEARPLFTTREHDYLDL